MKKKRFEIGLLVLFLIICLHLIGVKSMACEVQTVTANVTYPEGWFLTYSPNNPETIEPSSEETIRIFGCRPPFTWSVEGNGFDLSDDETVTLFNTLGADGTACGSATITITDNFGASDTGYVRCTNGQWVFKGNICVISGPGNVDRHTRIIGNKKQVQTYALSYCASSGCGAVWPFGCSPGNWCAAEKNKPECITFTCQPGYWIASYCGCDMVRTCADRYCCTLPWPDDCDYNAACYYCNASDPIYYEWECLP